jgi:uncharacterized membrane protein
MANTNRPISGLKIKTLYNLYTILLKIIIMKHLYILVSMVLMMLLISCGTAVEPTVTQSGAEIVEITPEEEELITELLEEVTEEEIMEVAEEIAVDIDEEEELPALDLATTSFTGNGTEPFWGFTASGTTLILREPSDSGPMDTTTFSGVSMSNVGTSVNMTASGMNLNLTLGTCSDGMSDIVYTYSTAFTAGATSYTGCAYID